jgi:hypothetical protein
MPEYASVFASLLLPVFVLLFLSRRLSRRIRYPHDLIEEDRRRGPAALFLRTFRLRHDFIFDAAIAAVLAFTILDKGGVPPAGAEGPGSKGPRSALVLDCSRSMLAGIPGHRPIDEAIKILATDKTLADSDRWLLAFDPLVPGTRLRKWAEVVGDLSGEAIVTRLAGELSFFAVDYEALKGLGGKGYKDITFITDAFPYSARGFRVIETGFAGPGADPVSPDPGAGETSSAGASAAWPASVRFDRATGSYRVSLIEAGRRGGLQVGSWNGNTERWITLSASRYSVEDRKQGRELRLPGPGIYLLSLDDPMGAIGMDFPVRLDPGPIAGQAIGDFSSLVLKVFPLIEVGPRPRILLKDLGAKEGVLGISADGSMLSIVTTFEPETPYLVDPGITAGRPLAVGLVKGVDFVWGPRSLANMDLPLAYDGSMQASIGPPFLTELPKGARRLMPAGASFLVIGPNGDIPLIPPNSEFWKPSTEGFFTIERPPKRLLWSGILALLLVAKYLTWRLLTGKNLFARGA